MGHTWRVPGVRPRPIWHRDELLFNDIRLRRRRHHRADFDAGQEKYRHHRNGRQSEAAPIRSGQGVVRLPEDGAAGATGYANQRDVEPRPPFAVARRIRTARRRRRNDRGDRQLLRGQPPPRRPLEQPHLQNLRVRSRPASRPGAHQPARTGATIAPTHTITASPTARSTPTGSWTGPKHS